MSMRSPVARIALSIGLLLLMGRAPAANAVPLFFLGPDGFGFAEADALAQGIDLVIDSSFTYDSAGDPMLDPTLDVTTSLIGLIGPEPLPPTVANPLVAIVEYEVTNTTGSVLDNEYLLFTLGAVEGDPDPWPFIEPAEFGLDSEGILIAHAAPYYFGAVLLPLMAPGDVHTFQIVHVVTDDLGGTIIPSPGLALLVNENTVPEPGAALLVALGFGVLISMARRRNELVRTRMVRSRAAAGVPDTGVSFGNGGR